MLFQTTPAHEELRAKIRAFAEEEIKPIAFMLDQQNEFPAEAIQKFGKLGFGVFGHDCASRNQNLQSHKNIGAKR